MIYSELYYILYIIYYNIYNNINDTNGTNQKINLKDADFFAGEKR